MLEPVHASPLATFLARALAALHPVGPRGVSFHPDALREAAVRDTGLEDFGEDDYEEPLEVLCRSLRDDAVLGPVGRLLMGGHAINALSTRLERLDIVKRRPEIFEAPLEPPLLVIGMPRSGTTLLHRLLSLEEHARPLRLFELQRPIRGPGLDRRRLIAKGETHILKLVAPRIDSKHLVDADEPEECMFLFDSSLLSFTFWVLAPVYGYVSYYSGRDKTASYRAYRQHLQIFQAEEPGRRLTLKAPVHTGNLEAIFSVLPEAMVVQTHRDPVRSVSSVNSLFHTFHSVTSDRVDIRRVAALNLALLADMARRNMDARPRHEGRVYDLQYADLVADPIDAVRRIYARFGLRFSEAFRARLERYMAERPKDRHGRHEYSAEEFGQTDAQIAAHFSEYRERFAAGPAGALSPGTPSR